MTDKVTDLRKLADLTKAQLLEQLTLRDSESEAAEGGASPVSPLDMLASHMRSHHGMTQRNTIRRQSVQAMADLAKEVEKHLATLARNCIVVIEPAHEAEEGLEALPEVTGPHPAIDLLRKVHREMQNAINEAMHPATE